MCNKAQGYYGFDHTRVHYPEGYRVKCIENNKVGKINQIIPTPGGWVYTIKYDTPVEGALQGDYGQFMADQLRPE